MKNISATSGKPPDAGTMDAERFLEREKAEPGDTRLLLEEDTVYAEDLVRLGLGWQDFRSLVIRARS